MKDGFNVKEFFRQNKRQVLGTIFLFWLIFALLIIAEDKVGVKLSGHEPDPVDHIQYIIRWMLWALMTPLIIFLAIQFPVTKKFFIRDLARHFAFALIIVGIEFAIEIPVVRYIALQITGHVAPISDYAAVFMLKLNFYLLLYFLVVGITFIILYRENYNRSIIVASEANLRSQQLQTQLAEAKLSLLKMQLDPHFLFNTHHAIIGLMLKNENENAIQMLTRLSDLLRLSLEDHQQTVTLEKEIYLLKLYLEIQQIRFHDRLKIEYQIEPETLSKKVPVFILQPLVENAIKHGISMRSPASGISITSEVRGYKLILIVENEGAQIDLLNFKEGIGISNTKERLHQLYNGTSHFGLENLNGKVSATIKIPLTNE